MGSALQCLTLVALVQIYKKCSPSLAQLSTIYLITLAKNRLDCRLVSFVRKKAAARPKLLSMVELDQEEHNLKGSVHELIEYKRLVKKKMED